MVESQRVCMGFAFTLHEAHNVASTPLFHERMAHLYRTGSVYARTARILLYRYPKPWVRELARLFLEDAYEMVAKTPELELAEL